MTVSAARRAGSGSPPQKEHTHVRPQAQAYRGGGSSSRARWPMLAPAAQIPPRRTGALPASRQRRQAAKVRAAEAAEAAAAGGGVTGRAQRGQRSPGARNGQNSTPLRTPTTSGSARAGPPTAPAEAAPRRGSARHGASRRIATRAYHGALAAPTKTPVRPLGRARSPREEDRRQMRSGIGVRGCGPASPPMRLPRPFPRTWGHPSSEAIWNKRCARRTLISWSGFATERRGPARQTNPWDNA